MRINNPIQPTVTVCGSCPWKCWHDPCMLCGGTR